MIRRAPAGVGLASALLLLPQVSRPSSGLDADERCILFPTAAALDEGGRHWRVPVHAWVFEPETDDPLRWLLLKPIREALDLKSGTPECELFLSRARWFLVDNERREHPVVFIGDMRFRIGPTDQGGHCTATLDVPIEVAFAVPFYLSLVISFMKYWNLVIDNRQK